MKEKKKIMFDFPAVSKEDWLAVIKKELRGADISTIRKEVEKDIVLEPFYVDEGGNGEPVEMSPAEESIALGEVFDLNLPECLEQVKVSLAGGCDSPEFHFSAVGQIEEVFTFLNLSYVFSSYHSNFDNCEDLITLIAEKEEKAAGAILIPFNFEDEFWINREICAEKLANFKFGHIFHQYNEDRSEQIFMIATIFESYLHDGMVKGVELGSLVRSVVIEWKVGNDFLVECAAIKALQTILGNLLISLDYREGKLPYIQVRTAEVSLVEESHLNMIRLTTQAVIANYTRVDRVLLASGEIKLDEVRNFDRRISRNIQHLLTMESNIDKGVDALSGSYFFETLSAELAEKVWKKLDWTEK